MNADTMEQLNQIYLTVLKTGKAKYQKADLDDSIEMAQTLENYATYLSSMNEKIENILDLSDKYACECLDRATAIRQFIEANEKHKDKPFHLLIDNIDGQSWADITEREDETVETIKKVDEVIKECAVVKKKEFNQKTTMFKSLTDVYGVKTGFEFKLPIIARLQDLPTAFFWYNGDAANQAGVYTCLSRGFYIRVPLPNVIDTTQGYNRTGSIRCKYNTHDNCVQMRQELANRYNSQLRKCTFAHEGDKYVKIGTSFRCPSVPSFGAHGTLKSDINNVPSTDIQTMLMYSLSDMLLATMWFQKQKLCDNGENITFGNIEMC